MPTAYFIHNLDGVVVRPNAALTKLFGFANPKRNRASAFTLMGQFIFSIKADNILPLQKVDLHFEYTTLSMKKETLIYEIPFGQTNIDRAPLPIFGKDHICQSCFLSQGYVYMIGMYQFSYTSSRDGKIKHHGMARGGIVNAKPLPLFVELRVGCSTLMLTRQVHVYYDLVAIQY